MANGRWLVGGGLLCVGCLLALLAAPLWGQQEATADPAAEAADPAVAPAKDPSAAAKEEQELDIRYAEAYLRLMEATLGKYDEINRRAPNTIRPAVIQGLQDAARQARERVQLAKSDDVDDSQVYVSSAEADLKLAEEQLRNAQVANSRAAGAVPPGEVTRLQAQVALSKVRIERARHLASESPLSNVRYELEQLREDVQQLQILVALLRSRN